MPVTQAFCNGAKQDILNAVHAPGDVYKVALYNSASATLDKTTTAYTATGEITGAGYTAGGATLANRVVGASGDTAYLSFDDPSWANATFTADSALIYNSSKSNKAIAVLSFTAATSTNGTWTLDLPAAGASAILRLA
jgi:hypothetical protein